MNRQTTLTTATITTTVLAAALLTIGAFTAGTAHNTNTPRQPPPTATTTPDTIPPDCRTWIENELTDDTDDINELSGYAACGDLTDHEIDQAFEEVTEQLMSNPDNAPDTGDAPDTYSNGDHIVGEDIPPGTYETTGAEPNDYLALCAITTDPNDYDTLPQVRSASENERIIITLTEDDGTVSITGCQPLTPR